MCNQVYRTIKIPGTFYVEVGINMLCFRENYKEPQIEAPEKEQS